MSKDSGGLIASIFFALPALIILIAMVLTFIFAVWDLIKMVIVWTLYLLVS